jgi:SAM-dependent methyltransferase
MSSDWHKTQNEDYLELLISRIKNEDILNWVQQFVEIINKNNLDKNISINDIGCNVGHFCKAINKINGKVEYIGYDLSQTYLDIAKNNFKEYNFYMLDISKELPRKADITIISATLEHIENYKEALINILNTTNNMCIIRTFFGNDKKEYCLKNNAKESYLIREFDTDNFLNLINNDWSISFQEDLATKGIEKLICNDKNILRKQKVLILKK